MKQYILIGLVLILGCSPSKKVLYQHQNRSKLLKMDNDSVLTVDIRKKMLYGEFCNIFADACKRNHLAGFVSIKFGMNEDSVFEFPTYLPKPKSEKGGLSESTQFTLSLGKVNPLDQGDQKYWFKVEDVNNFKMLMQEIRKGIDSPKQSEELSNILVILASDSLEMRTEIIPILESVNRIGIRKKCFSLIR